MIKQFLKQLIFRFFGLKVDLPKMQSNMQVHVIDEHADNAYDMLGITEERARELHRKAEYILERNGMVNVTAWAEISKQCNHPNELVFCASIIDDMTRPPQFTYPFEKVE